MRGREVYNINQSRSHRFFRRTREIIHDIFSLVKPLAMIGLFCWGGMKYLTHGGQRTVKQGLRAQISAITDSELGKQFQEGLGAIRDIGDEMRYNNSARGKAERKAFHKIQQQRRKEYQEEGIDPTIKYLRPGDPGYKEELEFQRQLWKDFDR